MKCSIAFQTDKALRDYGPLATRAEELGFDGVSAYNDLFFQPAWPALMEMARTTCLVRLGPAAVNPFTCHPVQIAGHLALLDEASNGRAYLGMARGAWLERLGIQPPQPVRALREAFLCLRHLLLQDAGPFEGEYFPLKGNEALRWRILRPEIPFVLGSWGPKTIAACWSEIQEVKIGGSADPAVVRRYRQILDEGTQNTGHPVELVIGSVCVVSEDREAALGVARKEVALYLPVVAKLDPGLELDPQLLERIDQLCRAERFEDAGRLVPPDLLRRLALAGTPDEIVEQCLALREAGADRIEFGTPHGLSTSEGLSLLGTQVLPAIRGSKGGN